MAVHELKTDPNVFDDVVADTKTFEIRKDDRCYERGDYLYLRQTRYFGSQMKDEGKPLEYTGQVAMVRVLGVMRGPVYGLADGWCIMSIKRCY